MYMMTKISNVESKRIGKYLGPVLATLFLSEIVTLRIYTVHASPHLVYLNGFIMLLFGFYIVTIHNNWTRRWPVLITLSGWGATLLGVYRLFFPDAPQAPVAMSTIVMLCVFLAVELVICFKSYRK